MIHYKDNQPVNINLVCNIIKNSNTIIFVFNYHNVIWSFDTTEETQTIYNGLLLCYSNHL